MRENFEMMRGRVNVGVGRIMRALTAAGGMLVILGTAGCGGGNNTPAQAVQPPAVLAVPVVVSGTVTDAATSAAIPAAVTVSGAVVYDSTGTAKSTFTTSTGVVSFKMKTVPSTPVTLNLVVTANGYLSGSERIEIKRAGDFAFNVSLVKISGAAAPIGITTATTTVTASSGGALNAPISLTATGTSSAPSATEITIPAGDVLTAADGTPLSGNLTVVVTNFNPKENTALTAFPGGLNNVAIATGGADGAFLTAGFTAVEVTDASGKVAKNLSTPMTIRINIPAGTGNPLTGAAVKAGDTIPVWSYDQADGTWQPETSGGIQVNGPVQADTNGLFIRFTSKKFSYWNLDWFMQPVCPGTLNFVGADSITVELIAWGPGFFLDAIKPAGEKSLDVTNVPRGFPLQLDAYFNGRNVGSLSYVDFCSTPTLAMAVNVMDTLTTFTVSVSKVCEQDHEKRSQDPSAPVYYSNASGVWTFAGVTKSDGTLTFNAPVGSIIEVEDDSGNLITPSSKKGDDREFEEEVECEPVTGSTGSGGGGQ